MKPDTNNMTRMSIESRTRIANPGSGTVSERHTVRMYGTTSVDIVGNAYPKNVSRKMSVPYRCIYILRVNISSDKKEAKMAMF